MVKKTNANFEDELIRFLIANDLELTHIVNQSRIRPGWTVSDWNFEREREFDSLKSAIQSAKKRK